MALIRARLPPRRSSISPPTAWPAQRSRQVEGPLVKSKLEERDVGRQRDDPSDHQSGIVAPPVWMSITISLPTILAIPAGATKLPTRVLTPTLVLQANVLNIV